MSESKARTHGYQCPVRGCPQRNNRRFSSPASAAAHIVAKHGDAELAKRLRLTTGVVPGGNVKRIAKSIARQAGATPAPVTLKAPHVICIMKNGRKGFERTVDFDGDILEQTIFQMAGLERMHAKEVKIHSAEFKTEIVVSS